MDLNKLSENQDKLLKKLENAKQQLLKNPHVLAVGIGIKETNNQFTDDIAFRVFVAEKKSLKSLKTDELIPQKIEDVITDVLTPYKVTNRPGVCGSEREVVKKYRPLHAGIPISPDPQGYGTLGWFGTLDSDGSTVMLSNFHVMYDPFVSANTVDNTEKKIAQPQLGRVSKCCCCECGSDNVIGKTVLGVYSSSPLTSTAVDCAIAKIDTEFTSDLSLNITNDSTSEVLTVSGTAAAVVGTTVRKIGARSGFTTGTVVHIGDTAVEATDPDGATIAIRTGQVLVIPVPSETYQVKDDTNDLCKFAFSNSGDSGSVILNASNQIVALLYGGDEVSNSVDVTFGNNIANVLSALSSNGSAITLSTTPSGSGLRSRKASSTLAAKPSPGSLTNKLQIIRDANNESLLYKLYDKHFEEVLGLVNECRAVTLVWQRNQGPAYVAAIARTAKVESYKVPLEINGSSRQELLKAMLHALIENGSEKLIEDLQLHGEKLIATMLNGISISDFALELLKAGYIDNIPNIFNSKI
ncbi:hypothetical protein SAMN06265379_10194 [Saccharicrinis carchari]|uniref:Trypsin-like peptidase domain-containing protein n=1 Tax=Saccharicrinis carchari TaxID=1168039 RepID=A0A521AEV9_SACCC|nr:hypothetical protein [Saccharicrinis carchari]SMO33319.1 hypothetical protein SAMN06265379_10194 [Saccharicrinis carchari]